jgi:hypothetical protein
MPKILNNLKKYYQSLFKEEPKSVTNLMFYKTFCFLAGMLYRYKYRRELRTTNNFIKINKKINSLKGKNVFVFANGPSLSDIDLNKISQLCDTGNFDLIAINSFLSKSQEIVLPKYAVFSDNVHFSAVDINSQYRMDVEVCKKNNITYFLPAKYHHSTIGQRLAYCSLCNIYSKNINDISKPAGYYGVTAFFALSLAKSLGYKNIFLCGFDNSYFKDFSLNSLGEMVIKHKHYYDGENSELEVPCLYKTTADFFFDVYRHFYYLKKITKENINIFNIAKTTYLNFIPKDLSLDVYKI